MNTRAAASRAASTSSVTQIGKPAAISGAGRPASAAASLIVGTVSDANVEAPVIHVIVPPHTAPASRNICGPSAASNTGGSGASMVTCPRAVTVSVAMFTASPRTSGISAARYSRACRTGLSNEYPHIPSTTTWCESPIPSVKRPPVRRLAVFACSAITIGWRGYVGTTEVPNWMSGTCWATAPMRVIASTCPMICDSQYDAKPASAEAFASSTSASKFPLPATLEKMPMSISAT